MSEIYKKILKDGSKVQVESAIRDGEGVKISTNYAKKSEIPKKQIIELVENGSTTAGTWLAKTDEITSLVDGQLFLYKVAVAGATSTTLNISYKNSGGTYTSLGAKTVYSQATTSISTKFGVGCYVLFVYNTTNDCFRVVSNYDSDSNDIGVRDYYFRPYTASEPLYRYKLVALNKDNKVVPLTVTNQTSTTQVAKVPTQVEFRPENIWYYNSTTTVSANAVVTANVLYKSMYGTTASYMFNASIPAYRLVYLKGIYNKTTGLFKLYKDNSSPCTSYYTSIPTNTNGLTLSSYFTSGYYYILVGGTYSSADYISYFGETQMFYFDGTNLIPYTLKLMPSTTSDLTNDSGYITSSALTGYATQTWVNDTKESLANKVSSWRTTPDNTHYPTEKLVKDNLDNIRAVAEGKNKAYVSIVSGGKLSGSFYDASGSSISAPTITATTNSFYVNVGNSTNRSQIENYASGTAYVDDFKIGDVLYLTNTDVPDFWMSGKDTDYETGDTYVSFSKLETTKVDLNGYATQSWVNGRGFLTSHQDISGKLDKSGGTMTGAITLGHGDSKGILMPTDSNINTPAGYTILGFVNSDYVIGSEQYHTLIRTNANGIDIKGGANCYLTLQNKSANSDYCIIKSASTSGTVRGLAIQPQETSGSASNTGSIVIGYPSTKEATSSYKVDINGSLNATTIYENGSRVAKLSDIPSTSSFAKLNSGNDFYGIQTFHSSSSESYAEVQSDGSIIMYSDNEGGMLKISAGDGGGSYITTSIGNTIWLDGLSGSKVYYHRMYVMIMNSHEIYLNFGFFSSMSENIIADYTDVWGLADYLRQRGGYFQCWAYVDGYTNSGYVLFSNPNSSTSNCITIYPLPDNGSGNSYGAKSSDYVEIGEYIYAI